MSPFLQQLAPQKALTFIAHVMANCEIPWVKNALIRYFVNRYPVNMQEAEEKDPYQYHSFNHFFTRSLDPTARVISKNPDEISCPVDGAISEMGYLEEGKILQAKGCHFSAQTLLGGDPNIAAPFLNGAFLTAYLAPKDYHRVHTPLEGHLIKTIYIPGSLFSVNQNTTNHISNLFARNERLVSLFETKVGKVAVIMVGAMIVGSIETTWGGTVTPPHGNKIQTQDYANPIFLKKAEELGRFKLGSTVILLFEPNKILWDESLKPNQTILMGQRLGSCLNY